MNLNDVMDELGAQLGTIPNLNVYDFPADHVTPPAAVVSYPDEITYDVTYVRGGDRMTIPVIILAGKAFDRSSRDKLAAYAAGSGPQSIKQVLEAGEYTAMDSIRLMTAEFDIVRIAGVDYAAAMFDVDIIGAGA